MAWHTQNTYVLTISMQITGQNSGGVRRLQHYGAGAITKQHARRAVIEIKNAGENLGADNQSTFGSAGLDHRICNRQSINKTAAHGLHIKSRTTVGAQFVLQDTGG